MLNALFLLLLALPVLAGLGLVVAGLVGRRTETPPRCWSCRSDLSGIEAIQRAEYPAACPSCTYQLRNPGDLRFRTRRRMPSVWIAGLAVGGLGISALAALRVATDASMNVLEITPTTPLIGMARNGSLEAFYAIKARAALDNLTESDWDTLAPTVAEAFVREPDAEWMFSSRVPWRVLYPDLVEAGRVDPDVARELAARFIDVRVELPEDLRADDPLPIRVYVSAVEPSDHSWHDSTSHEFGVELLGIRVNGQSVFTADHTISEPDFDIDWLDDRTQFIWTWEGGEQLPTIRLASDAEPGDATVEVDLRITGRTDEGGDSPLTRLIASGSPVGPLERTLRVDTWIDAEPDPGSGEPAPWSAQTSLHAALSHGCDCGRAPGVKLEITDTTALPEHAAIFYDVYLEHEGERWFLGTKRLSSEDDDTEAILTQEQADSVASSDGALLILEPSPWNARRYVDRATPIDTERVERWVIFEDTPEDQ